MKIQRIAGVYVATQRNKRGGGYIATDKTRQGALTKIINLNN